MLMTPGGDGSSLPPTNSGGSGSYLVVGGAVAFAAVPEPSLFVAESLLKNHRVDSATNVKIEAATTRRRSVAIMVWEKARDAGGERQGTRSPW